MEKHKLLLGASLISAALLTPTLAQAGSFTQCLACPPDKCKSSSDQSFLQACISNCTGVGTLKENMDACRSRLNELNNPPPAAQPEPQQQQQQQHEQQQQQHEQQQHEQQQQQHEQQQQQHEQQQQQQQQQQHEQQQQHQHQGEVDHKQELKYHKEQLKHHAKQMMQHQESIDHFNQTIKKHPAYAGRHLNDLAYHQDAMDFHQQNIEHHAYQVNEHKAELAKQENNQAAKEAKRKQKIDNFEKQIKDADEKLTRLYKSLSRAEPHSVDLLNKTIKTALDHRTEVAAQLHKYGVQVRPAPDKDAIIQNQLKRDERKKGKNKGNRPLPEPVVNNQNNQGGGDQQQQQQQKPKTKAEIIAQKKGVSPETIYLRASHTVVKLDNQLKELYQKMKNEDAVNNDIYKRQAEIILNKRKSQVEIYEEYRNTFDIEKDRAIPLVPRLEDFKKETKKERPEGKDGPHNTGGIPNPPPLPNNGNSGKKPTPEVNKQDFSEDLRKGLGKFGQNKELTPEEKERKEKTLEKLKAQADRLSNTGGGKPGANTPPGSPPPLPLKDTLPEAVKNPGENRNALMDALKQNNIVNLRKPDKTVKDERSEAQKQWEEQANKQQAFIDANKGTDTNTDDEYSDDSDWDKDEEN